MNTENNKIVEAHRLMPPTGIHTPMPEQEPRNLIFDLLMEVPLLSWELAKSLFRAARPVPVKEEPAKRQEAVKPLKVLVPEQKPLSLVMAAHLAAKAKRQQVKAEMERLAKLRAKAMPDCPFCGHLVRTPQKGAKVLCTHCFHQVEAK